MIKKLLTIFGSQILSKEEQKSLMGGAYSCTCNGSKYKWVGEYASYKEAEADFVKYCHNSGATCHNVEI